MLRRALRVGILICPLVLLAGQGIDANITAQSRRSSTVADQLPEPANAGYVGSRACSKCHLSIYESFSRTDMGRSMSEITPSLLEKMAVPESIFDPKLNRHFEIFARDHNLYQSEYETTADGKDAFRETRKLEWIIGSGANGSGAIVKQDDYLFEAPLSLYARTHRWALSPGYEFGDYGFNRPILPGCIVCHSGQPRPILDGDGRFQKPPFAELAIGCENCHGPGLSHVAAANMGDPTGSIANPAKLSPWLADNICMSCHQAGDARVLQPGKTYRDFRPGAELDDTLSIFMVPFTRQSAPKDDLLQHYLSMRLSKCYRKSGGRLGCLSCHDPHVQPSRQEAPAYFRQKCLACHTEKSCALPLSLRQHETPPDDCAGCHMPKRDVTVISHSVLTNHRIVAEVEEPFPDVAFHMTTPQLPDLVQLSANPAKQNMPRPLILLQAYRQVMLEHPEYRARYWSVAEQLKTTQPGNVHVLEALADEAVQNKNAEGSAQAIGYLEEAVLHGATNPTDFEELAELLVAADRQTEAVNYLHQGMQLAPYDVELYRLSATIYFVLNKTREACEVAAEGSRRSPQNDAIRDLMNRCSTASVGLSK
ncbi:MAG: hypothetical protein WAM69_01875 [Candidatus Sulfotelmatobacter sp.]